MGVQSIGKEDFQQTVEKGGILFIDWWAPWCGPCRAFAPVYEKVAEANPDAVFAKINTDENPAVTAQFPQSTSPVVKSTMGSGCSCACGRFTSTESMKRAPLP